MNGTEREDTSRNALRHSFSLSERNSMEIEGVSNILRFDTTAALLETSAGNMEIEGEDLRIGILDTASGHVSLCGKIDAVYYETASDTAKKNRRHGRG